jgi:hypothetical protein
VLSDTSQLLLLLLMLAFVQLNPKNLLSLAYSPKSCLPRMNQQPPENMQDGWCVLDRKHFFHFIPIRLLTRVVSYV